MKRLRCLIIGMIIIMTGAAQGQSLKDTYRRKLFMKVTTDHHIYRGRLYYVSDSSIRVIRGFNNKDLPARVAVQDIQKISFKRKNALIKNVFGGILIGALCGGWLPSKISGLGIYVSDKTFLYAIIGGAGLGFIVGALTPNIKITIPIHKSQQLFEDKRSKLKELSIY